MSKDQKWAVEMTEYQTVFEPFVYVYFYAETETVPLHSAQNRNRYPNRSVPFRSRSLQPETQNRPYLSCRTMKPTDWETKKLKLLLLCGEETLQNRNENDT